MKSIPKKIHYCWFGKSPLPPLAVKCIDSWHKHMPDYEIIRWDESNFDINISNYTKEAYNKQLYAFVSDYARFYILNKHGGIYLDTDVEIIKPLHEILINGPSLGIETNGQVNPGLGMAAIPNMSFINEIIDFYNALHFIRKDGTINYNTIVFYISSLLHQKGWDGEASKFQGFRIYPTEYFCPLDYQTGKLQLTNNTFSIHHFAASWIKTDQKIYQLILKLFGNKVASLCSKIYKTFK